MYKEEDDGLDDAEPRSPLDLDLEAIEARIRKHFKVYEVERDIHGIPRGQIAAFYVQMEKTTFNAEFEALREELRAVDPNLLVILQHRLGEDVLLVARKPPIHEKGPAVNLVLLLLTAITTTLGGAIFAVPFAHTENTIRWLGVDAGFLHPRALLLGFVTFSVPLLLILGIHELGHFFVARRHHVRTSLPYFIPVPPPVPFGTFGAFISMREPIPDRKALFDIGASGPVLGFLVAIPVVILGTVLTGVYAVQVPDEPAVDAALEGPLGAFSQGAHTTGATGVHDHNATFAFGWATFASHDETSKGARIGVEDVEFHAVNATLPSGTWRVAVQGHALTAVARAELRLRLHNESATNATGDFSPDRTGLVANVQRSVSPTNDTAAYSFDVPQGVTRLALEMRWQRPPSAVVQLGDSLLFRGLKWAVDRFYPVPENLFTHPTGIAGWVGLLVTGFNLLPAGQLDGGHVARAVLGDRQRWASWISIGLMVVLGLQFNGWWVMAILLLFLGLQHPPPLNDKSTLDPRRRWLAALVFVLLVVTFVPYPFVPA